MTNTKTKKRATKIILAVLLSLFVISNVPAAINNFIESTPPTAFAQDVDGNNADTEEGPAGAQPPAEGEIPETSTPAEESTLQFVNVLVAIQRFLNRLIWPILVMIGGLMQNDLLFGSGMEAYLRDIWIPIRNIVNILFVVALVGIALYNILGIGDENSSYSLKAILPKLIIGIIAVNFSFFGIKIFLDAINILTTSVFALPSQVSEEMAIIIGKDDIEDKNKVSRFCKLIQGVKLSEKITHEELQEEGENAIYRIIGQRYAERGGFKIKASDTKEVVERKVTGEDSTLSESQKEQFRQDIENAKRGRICNGLELTSTGSNFLNRYDSKNAALAMALNMSQILVYSDIEINVDNIEKLFTNTVLSTLLYLIYLVSFIALFIVLLARLVVLWLAIAISPVLVLGMAIPVVKEKISGFGDLTSKFVQNAIAPLTIALAMSVGWIMLNAISGLNQFDNTSALSFDISNGIPVVGLNTLQDLIVSLGTIAVVWLGVFGAASKTVAAPITDALRGYIKDAGKFIGTLPLKHVPLVPIKVGENEDTYTLEQLGQVWTNLRTAPSQKADKLVDALKLGGITRFTDTDKVQTPSNLYSVFKEHEKAKPERLQEEVNKFMETSNGKSILREMKSRGGKDQMIAKSIEKFAKAEGDDVKKLKKELYQY
ncbi:hypothetical protein GF366_01365, partial [Candidatus Peregrinibacteria bacterium]|nr:hypothetical protein [Candidatus Peregrinibacteria bacterium]